VTHFVNEPYYVVINICLIEMQYNQCDVNNNKKWLCVEYIVLKDITVSIRLLYTEQSTIYLCRFSG